MMDQKPNDRFNLRELSDTPRKPLEGNSNSIEDVSEIIVLPLLDTRESRYSGRLVRALDWFMFLGETVSDEHDLDPNSYNETISDK